MIRSALVGPDDTDSEGGDPDALPITVPAGFFPPSMTPWPAGFSRGPAFGSGRVLSRGHSFIPRRMRSISFNTSAATARLAHN